MPVKKRIIFGITGASGMPLAKYILRCFSKMDFLEIHLIVSDCARTVLDIEQSETIDNFFSLVHITYNIKDFSASPASGSWLHDGMIICPCSMSSLASIATGCGMNLIHRSADVCLKERRPLILVTRETPLNRIQLINMLNVTEAGACIMPFSPAFYTQDYSLQGMFQQFAGRILDLLHIENNLCVRWHDMQN